MALITGDELARAGILVVFGGSAGMAALFAPGTLLWTGPALLGALAMGVTVSEVREEAVKSLPALQAGLRALPRPAALLPQRERQPAAAVAAAPRPAPLAAAAAKVGPLRPREWLRAVNDRPDDNPHLTVMGPSGSGKTTFVSAALGQRPGRVVVLTPKVSPGAWRGAEVVSLDDDLSYAPLAAAIEDLKTEAKQRTLALRRGEPLEPLTVVLDELPELHAEIPGAGKFAVRLSRWGRELGIRQVVIATSDDALNIPGWAATRSNYARVELGKPADDGSRPATLDGRPLDLGALRQGAERAELRPWRAAKGAPAEGETIQLAPTSKAQTVSKQEADALLASYFYEAIPSHQDAEECPIDPVPRNRINDHSSITVEPGSGPGVTLNVIQTVTGKERRKDDTDAYTQALIALYRAAGADGITFSKAYAQHKGTKEIVFTAWQEGRNAARAERHEGA